MGSTKCKNKCIETDIISKLPDDVLTNIISRLEVEDAVKTSILSSRWKLMWTSINNLRFESHPDLHSHKDVTLFLDFVENVLRCCQSKSIKEFHLEMKNALVIDSNAAHIEDFISLVVALNVHALTLKFVNARGSPWFRLPQSILTCQSLERLTLDFYDPVVDIPESTMCFPNLKFLSVSFVSPDYPNKLLGNCPVLEELILKECFESDDVDNLEALDINIPSLRKLKLDLVSEFDGFRRVIRTPNLEYLCVFEICTCFLMGEYPCLDKIILHGCTIFHDNDQNCFERFIKAISWTRCLLLSSDLFEFAISYLTDNLSVFSNLVRVYFEFELSNPPSLAIKLLSYMPNVEDLVLHNDDYKSPYPSNTHEEYELVPPDSVPSCVWFKLKKIHFMNVERMLLKLVKYFLENSKYLESFSARVIGTSKREKMKTKKEIGDFPRASSVCRIGFFNSSEMHKIIDSWYEGWYDYD